ncbi:hypothetical protein WN48_07255 [Eufriesea mexicana]|uniref:Uncharacterized protein n=1 Tax=Eufriesea mexicana TaxID=516756 RepID=A0A310SLX1_9HYME|nr:hypothetical protein WN48_07255 [Eufriesea mexicana]
MGFVKEEINRNLDNDVVSFCFASLRSVKRPASRFESVFAPQAFDCVPLATTQPRAPEPEEFFNPDSNNRDCRRGGNRWKEKWRRQCRGRAVTLD